MAEKYLGSSFDIHGGGVDLRFPHHENEQAQSRAAGHGFASYWLHNAWITTSGEKMSKSLGNSLLVPEVLKQVRGVELRYYMVAAHYRSHVEFSFEALQDAASAYRRIEGFLDRAGAVLGELVADTSAGDEPYLSFARAMDDDLGTPAAVAVIHDAVRLGNKQLADNDLAALRSTFAHIRNMLGVLGLDPNDPTWGGSSTDETRLTQAIDVLVAGLLEQRNQARADKDWATARVRNCSMRAKPAAASSRAW
jgi:cysteinyl-tRNA synthetase